MYIYKKNLLKCELIISTYKVNQVETTFNHELLRFTIRLYINSYHCLAWYRDNKLYAIEHTAQNMKLINFHCILSINQFDFQHSTVSIFLLIFNRLNKDEANTNIHRWRSAVAACKIFCTKIYFIYIITPKVCFITNNKHFNYHNSRLTLFHERNVIL